MSDRDANRRRLLVVVFAAMILVVGSLAAAGTYALFTDTEGDSAGTISVVKKNQTPVKWKGCKKADVTPDDPSDFDMTVTLVDGRSASYNETDFDPGADGTFTYATKDYWPGNPDMSELTLDGTTYKSSCA